jgi:transcriptional regulator with XRE-family HTH domain
MKRDFLDPGITEAEENFLIDCQFLVQDLINAKGLSRTELAKRAGISKSRLSQLLSAEANPSAKTFARLFHVLGARVVPQVVEEEISTLARSQAVEDLWRVEELTPPAVPKRRTKASSWIGIANDNYVVVENVDGNLLLEAA